MGILIGIVIGGFMAWLLWSLLWDVLRLAGSVLLIAAMIAWVPVHLLFRLLGYRGGAI